MRFQYFLIALFWEQRALCADQQVPLGDGHLDLSTDDAPEYRPALLELHKSLVSIKSTSNLEYEVGDWLANYLFEKGWKSTIQFVPPTGGEPDSPQRMNIVAWPDRDEPPSPKVLLTSHIDTVPPHIPYRTEDGKITKKTTISGRGSVDAKASVAAMIIAVDELLKASKVKGSEVMLAFVVGEETTGDGMRWFSNSLDDLDHRPNFDAVIFGEPTENKLACGHKGSLLCRLDVRGVGGHSGYPWLGKSANELVFRAMVKVMDADLGSSERFGNTTVNAGRVEGGVAANVIPEHASVNMVTRVALGPQEKGALIVEENMRAIFNDIDEEAFTFVCYGGYGLVETDCDVEGFETTVVNYGTDIPNLAGNHTRYLYGPGTIFVAHGPNESITVGDLETAVEEYQRLVLHSLGK